MIRIAFFLPHLRVGGAERCVVNWIGALDRARYEPLLFLNRVEGEFLDLLPGDVTPIPLGGQRAALLPRRIAALLAEHRIDVAYSATNAMNLALLAARTPTLRIVSEHTLPTAYLAEAKLPALRRMAMRRLYPRADAIAVPTDRIGVELAETLGRRLPVVTIPNPVVGEIASSERAPSSETALRLLSAGRLVPAKGFDTLIDACAFLAAQEIAFRLEIRGDGPLRDDLIRRAANAGLAGRVTFSGYGDLSAAMRDADLFVLASRREGFGNVLVEAMAAGLPVLATRSGGPDSFVEDGANGWLVPPNDSSALADAIARLAEAPIRDATIAAGYATARGYGIAASTAQLSALIDRLAASRSMAA